MLGSSERTTLRFATETGSGVGGRALHGGQEATRAGVVHTRLALKMDTRRDIVSQR